MKKRYIAMIACLVVVLAVAFAVRSVLSEKARVCRYVRSSADVLREAVATGDYGAARRKTDAFWQEDPHLSEGYVLFAYDGDLFSDGVPRGFCYAAHDSFPEAGRLPAYFRPGKADRICENFSYYEEAAG